MSETRLLLTVILAVLNARLRLAKTCKNEQNIIVESDYTIVSVYDIVIALEALAHISEYVFLLCDDSNSFPSIILHNRNDSRGQLFIGGIGTKKVREAQTITQFNST